jgi:hypothetical protein
MQSAGEKVLWPYITLGNYRETINDMRFEVQTVVNMPITISLAVTSCVIIDVDIQTFLKYVHTAPIFRAEDHHGHKVLLITT